jgi:hypothetical protein
MTMETALKSSLEKRAMLKLAAPVIKANKRESSLRNALVKKAMVKSARAREQALRSVQWRGFAEELIKIDPELTKVAGFWGDVWGGIKSVGKAAWGGIKAAGTGIADNPLEALSIGLMFIPGVGTVAGGLLRGGLAASKALSWGAKAAKGAGLLGKTMRGTGAAAKWMGSKVLPNFTRSLTGAGGTTMRSNIGGLLRQQGWGAQLKGLAGGTALAGVVGAGTDALTNSGGKSPWESKNSIVAQSARAVKPPKAPKPSPGYATPSRPA